MKYLFIIMVLASVTQTGCYYDKAELLNLNTGCDTLGVITFSGTVRPVLNANCTGCHSGINAPNGVTLDNYAGVRTQVINNKLLNVIRHTPGFTEMPKNANKLDSCNIAKIRKWVDLGYQDN